MIWAAWLIAASLAAAPMPPPKPDVSVERPAATLPTPIPKPAHRLPAPVPKPTRKAVQGQTLLPGVATSSAGRLCQDPRLEGQTLSDIVSANQACGVRDPVRITHVRGIPLSTPATLDCRTAGRFADWMDRVARPAIRDELGKDVEGVWVMASYACRTRNNQPGARISEHGKGRAIDIGGFTLEDRSRITVQDDWGKGSAGKALLRMHAQSCGLFKTVLGPEADIHHKNHFHLDTSQRSGSAYCR